MITSHVTNIYGIIDTFTNPMTTKFTRMVKKTCTNVVAHVVVKSEPLGHATNMVSSNFSLSYNNQTWQDCRH